MAQKNILKQKTNLDKPVKKVSTLVDDSVRIRNNEKARLRRLEDKLDETRNRKEKAALQSKIKVQADSVRKMDRVVDKSRKYAKEVYEQESDLKELKRQEAKLNRALEKAKSSKNEKLHEEIRNSLIKGRTEIESKKDRIGGVLYRLNKSVGIEPERIVEKLDLSDKFIKRKLAKDLGDEYFDKKEKEKLKRRTRHQERKKEELDSGDFVLELSSIFWKVWKDFKTNESPRLSSYDRVIFVIEGDTFSYSGDNITLIKMKADDLWAKAREYGSDTYVTKFITVDRKKLKYNLDV